MSFTIKEKYARIDVSKLPDNYKKEYDEIISATNNFEDKDAVEIYQDEGLFDDLYKLIEENYPDAIKKSSKVIPKTKSSKKTTVKKKDKKARKLTPKDIEFIESALTNDEASDDQEMIAHFMKEAGLNENQAKRWVAKRNKYLKKAGDPKKTIDYTTRTSLKKGTRKNKNIIKTMDGHEFDRTSKTLIGKIFYDENGKKYTCKGYNAKLEECILKDDKGKEIVSCLKDMWVDNPKDKKSGDEMIDDCRGVLKGAGYKVVKQKGEKKTFTVKKMRPEKVIINERVGDAFKPIMKDITGSKEKDDKYEATTKAISNIQGHISRLLNRLNNLAEDNDTVNIKKIEKLLSEIIP